MFFRQSTRSNSCITRRFFFHDLCFDGEKPKLENPLGRLAVVFCNVPLSADVSSIIDFHQLLSSCVSEATWGWKCWSGCCQLCSSRPQPGLDSIILCSSLLLCEQKTPFISCWWKLIENNQRTGSKYLYDCFFSRKSLFTLWHLFFSSFLDSCLFFYFHNFIEIWMKTSVLKTISHSCQSKRLGGLKISWTKSPDNVNIYWNKKWLTWIWNKHSLIIENVYILHTCKNGISN